MHAAQHDGGEGHEPELGVVRVRSDVLQLIGLEHPGDSAQRAADDEGRALHERTSMPSAEATAGSSRTVSTARPKRERRMRQAPADHEQDDHQADARALPGDADAAAPPVTSRLRMITRVISTIAMVPIAM